MAGSLRTTHPDDRSRRVVGSTRKAHARPNFFRIAAALALLESRKALVRTLLAFVLTVGAGIGVLMLYYLTPLPTFLPTL